MSLRTLVRRARGLLGLAAASIALAAFGSPELSFSFFPSGIRATETATLQVQVSTTTFQLTGAGGSFSIAGLQSQGVTSNGCTDNAGVVVSAPVGATTVTIS